MAEGLLAALIAAQEAADKGDTAGTDRIVAATNAALAEDPYASGTGWADLDEDFWARIANPPQPNPPQPKPLPRQLLPRQRQRMGGASLAGLGIGAGLNEPDSTLAAGFPLFAQMMDFVLRAQAERRAMIDQSVSIARLFSDLSRVSPTRAADMAVRLGLARSREEAPALLAAPAAIAGTSLPSPQAGLSSGSAAPAIDTVKLLGESTNSLFSGLDSQIMGSLQGILNPDFSFSSLFGTGTNFAKASGGMFAGLVGNQQVSVPGTLSGRELDFLSANPNVANIIQDISDKFGNPDVFARSMSALIPTISRFFSGGF